MQNITEKNLVAPAIYVLGQGASAGPMSTAVLANSLRKMLKPKGVLLQTVDSGRQVRFVRTVRNLRSHRTLERSGLVVCVDNAFSLTEAGNRVFSKLAKRVAEATKAGKAGIAKTLTDVVLI